MNNRRGFTLVEIIAAVIILGIISIIAIVTYTGDMKEFRENYYSSLERSIVESGKDFFEDNRSYRPSAIFGAQKVPISLLESKTYIDEVLDYNGNKCDRSSYVIAIKRGKNDYIYHACLVCSEDAFSNISDKYCDSSWEDLNLVRPSIGEMEDIYIYINTSQEKLREKLTTKVSITKYDKNGNVIDTISGDGIDDIPSILPENIDIVDTKKIGTYVVTYKYNDNSVDRNVIVYENGKPNVKLSKTNTYAKEIVKNSVTEETEKTDYYSGEWAQEINMEFKPGIEFNTSSGANVSQYQWNKNGQWETICNEIATDGSCKNDYRIEMNEDISFRIIDTDGNISKETNPINIRIDRTQPTCTLALENGTLGLNDWYTSNVTIKFNEYKDNTSSVSSAKSDLKFYQIRKGSAKYVNSLPGTSSTNVVHSEDSKYIYYYGFVEDNAQNYGKCNIKVRKDATRPNCTLKVSTGTKGANDWYVTNVGVEFDTYTDTTSGVYQYGLSDYTGEKSKTHFTDIASVTYTGYIKDNAGNTNNCQITFKKDSTQPVCGSWSGESTSWTNGNRTISIGCSDTTSTCSQSTFSDTTNSGTVSTKAITITISDNAGNISTCSKTANVYVDKDAPSCGAITYSNSSTESVNVSVGCIETSGSTCSNNSFSTNGVTSSGNITISDRIGNTRSCPYTVYSQPQSRTASCNLHVEKTDPACGTEECRCSNCYTRVNTCKGGYDTQRVDSSKCPDGWDRESGGHDQDGFWSNCQKYNSCKTGSPNECKYGCDQCNSTCRRDEFDCETWNTPTSWKDVAYCSATTGTSQKTECRSVYRAR